MTHEKVHHSISKRINTLTAISLAYIFFAGWVLSSVWLTSYNNVREEYGNRLESLRYCMEIRQSVMEVHLEITNVVSKGNIDDSTEKKISKLDEDIRRLVLYSENKALKENERVHLQIVYGHYKVYQERWKEAHTYLEMGYGMKKDMRDSLDRDADSLLMGMGIFIKHLESSIDTLEEQSAQVVKSGIMYFVVMTSVLGLFLILISRYFLEETRKAADEIEAKLNEYLEQSGISPIKFGEQDVYQVVEMLLQAQERLTHRERLSVLGQFAGGIAHNLKTALMSVGAHVAVIERRIKKGESLEGIKPTFDKISPLIKYADRVVETLLIQTQGGSQFDEQSFTCNQVVSQLKVLLEYEMHQSKGEMIFENAVLDDVEMKGPINSLVQVLCNLIVNGMHAYNGSGGIVWVNMVSDQHQLRITVKDKGCGITKEVKDRLLNQIVTTKGSNGTGLGLYISNIIIRANFSGTLTIDSELGEGTCVTIELPI